MIAKQCRQIKLVQGIKNYFREKKGKEIKSVEIKNIELIFYKNCKDKKTKFQIWIYFDPKDVEYIDSRWFFPAIIYFIILRFKKYYKRKDTK